MEDDSSLTCQEQWNRCRRDRQAAAAMTTSEVTEELGLQTSTTSENNTACDECLENNIALEDDESICSACSGVCSLTHVIFYNLCRTTNTSSTITSTGTAFAHLTFPSWRLNWCPRRIGGNPNRHFSSLQSFLSNREIIFQAEEIPPMLLPS